MPTWVRLLFIAGFSALALFAVYNFMQLRSLPGLEPTQTVGESPPKTLVSKKHTEAQASSSIFSKQEHPFEALNLLPSGTPAPGFIAQSSQGDLTLADFKGQPLVLVFYQGYFCGICGAQLEGIQAQLDAFKQQGVKVVGVSADTLAQAERMGGERGLTFPLIADPEHRLIEAFGVANRNKENIAWPSVYILDGAGKVALAFADENGKRLQADELLAKLKELNLGKP